jgi:DNA-binding transcriptional LysR family regulator
MFNWNDLRHFLAVAREGSTLAAARTLGLNQSTVHRRMAALERELGHKIVERHPSGYRLTELGAELQPYAERIQEAVDAFERRLASCDRRLTGTIRVTCATTVAHRLMQSSLLDGFLARHPGLTVELITDDRFLDLAKGEADIAIRAGTPADESLVGRKIADVPWAVYASRAYVERHGCPQQPGDLNDHSVIGFDGDIADHQAARWLRTIAPRATIAVSSKNIPSVLLAVKSGAGLAPLPAPMADREADLVRVLGPIPELKSEIYLLTHADLRQTPRVSAFFDYCVAEIAALRAALRGSR